MLLAGQLGFVRVAPVCQDSLGSVERMAPGWCRAGVITSAGRSSVESRITEESGRPGS